MIWKKMTTLLDDDDKNLFGIYSSDRLQITDYSKGAVADIFYIWNGVMPVKNIIYVLLKMRVAKDDQWNNKNDDGSRYWLGRG